MAAVPPVPAALQRFLWDMQSMVEMTDCEREILLIGSDLLARLVARDDWLPEIFTIPDPAHSQQFALYADAQERFSGVATVLAGGQILPAIMAPVWEIIGVLRGAVRLMDGDGGGNARSLGLGKVKAWASKRPGAVGLANASGEGVSLVLHVHGGPLPGVHTPEGYAPEGYANAEDGVAYDIFSIQTRIED